MIRLRQTRGADSGREFEFDTELVRIGRMPDSDVNFDPEVDLDASGRHAEIRDEGGRYLLIDTGSRNGTWLNGQRIKHAALHTGDEIEFGHGGPKLQIAAIETRPGARAHGGPITGQVARRDPRFDALAMPVTATTHLRDLAAAPPQLEMRDDSIATKQRRRRPSRALLWGAVGVVFLAAIAIAVGALLR